MESAFEKFSFAVQKYSVLEFIVSINVTYSSVLGKYISLFLEGI